MSSETVHQIDCANRVISLAWDRAKTRDDVVPAYADLIRSGKTNVVLANHVIESRWSRHALDYIKRKAWNLVDQDAVPGES